MEFTVLKKLKKTNNYLSTTSINCFFVIIKRMEYIDIGRIIKERRKELNITQEELCEGICEPVTISRIENGKQLPSSAHLKAILERLDLPDEMFISLVSPSVFLNQTEFRDIFIDYESFFHLSNHQTTISLEELKKKISKIQCETIQAKQIQFILLTTLSITDNSTNIENLIQKTIEYIKMTIPNFSEDDFSTKILDHIEFSLILLLAILYFNKNYSSYVKLRNKLMFYADFHFSFSNNSDLIIIFILIFMSFVSESESKTDAYTLGIYAKEQCIKYQKYKYLGNLYEQLYYCSEKDNEKKEYLEKAYYIYTATENENGIQRINNIKSLNQ